MTETAPVPQKTRGFLAREWPYLFCAAFTALLLIGQLLAPPEGRTDAQPSPAKSGQKMLKQLIDEQPGPFLVYSHAVLAASLSACVLFLGRKARRQGLFDGNAPPAPAEWNEWDVVKVVFVVIFLGSAIAFFAHDDERGDAFMADSVAKLLGILVVFSIIRERGQRPADALGLRTARLGPALASALIAFFALVPVLVGASHLWERLLELLNIGDLDVFQDTVVNLATTDSVPLIVQIIIAAVVVAPVFEELCFRGLLYGLVRRRMPPALAIPAVGLIFGVFHPPLATMFPMFLFGSLLCYLYEKTGRLTVPIAIHFGFNLCQIGLIMSYRLIQ